MHEENGWKVQATRCYPMREQVINFSRGGQGFKEVQSKVKSQILQRASLKLAGMRSKYLNGFDYCNYREVDLPTLLSIANM